MDTTNATSPYRQAAFHAITTHVMRHRGDLIEQFCAFTEDRPSDVELLRFARSIGVENICDWVRLDRSLTTPMIRHHCTDCADLGQIEHDDGRWGRCNNCNPAPVAHLEPFRAAL